MEEVNCMFTHEHVDPRPAGTRRLMMLTPTYLTTNRLEGPQADHALLFEPLVKLHQPPPGQGAQF